MLVSLFLKAIQQLILMFPVQGITVPVIPGIMPIQTYASFQRLIKLCGSRVPPNIMAELEPISVRNIIVSISAISSLFPLE